MPESPLINISNVVHSEDYHRSLAEFADSLVKFSTVVGQTQEQIAAHHHYLRLNPDSHRIIAGNLFRLYGPVPGAADIVGAAAARRPALRSLAFGSIPPGKHYRHP